MRAESGQGGRSPTRRNRAVAVACGLLALLLHAAPILAQPFREPPRFFQASDGAQLAWHELGLAHAPLTLVFVPGWSMPGWIWRAQADAFSGRYRVVVFDPRGQGESEVPLGGYEVERRARDIAELLAAADAHKAILVGWSLGVLETLMFSQRHPMERVVGIVLVDNSVGEATPPASAGRFIPNLRRDRAGTIERFVQGLFRTPQEPSFLAALAGAAQRMPVEASIRLLSYPVPREFWRDSLYSLPVPTLYVVTSKFAEQAAAVAARKPAIGTYVLQGVGHALFVDDAPQFNALLAEFAQRLTQVAR
jgi:microsomal epoxide hydrolase